MAAFFTGVLALRRRQRTRQHETSGSEATTTTGPLSGSRRDGLQRLDEALRTMAHHRADRQSAPLPALLAARITPHAIQLLPGQTGRPLPPPATAGTGGWWELPHDADLPAAPATRSAPFPCPTLIPLGTSPTGDLLLLDLTEPGALLLRGSPDDVARVCTALLLEYALAPWAGDLHLIATGFADDLLHAPLADNTVYAPTPAAAVHALAERLLEAHQQPHTRPRACILLTATALDAATTRDLARLAAHPAPLPVIAVAPAPGVQDHFPDAVILDASATRPQPLHTTGLDLTLQRIDESAYQDLTALLTDSVDAGPPAPARAHADTDGPPVQAHSAHTEEPAHSPTAPAAPAQARAESDHLFPALTTAAARTTEPNRTDSTGSREGQAGSDRAHGAAHTACPTAPAAPCGPLPAAQPSAASSTPLAPQIRVLGPIEVDGVPHTGHGPRTAQLAALLYFRPGRTADTLCADMDPTTPWTTATLSARLHQLRRALGNTPDGDPYVPRRQHADDPYRLHPSIRCDWTEFRTLTDHALDQGTEGLDALEAALTLVRGRPFGSRALPWTEPHSQELTTRIVHTADVIARLRTPPGPHHDLTKARHAITTALDIDDTAESLYQAWFLIEAQADNRPGLHTAITRLQYINAALDRPLSHETERLIDELLHPQSPPAARS
ncbi:AfsR/SARP family transcriptional regulator [Streptomyces sp. 1222.5]|uniref:AfsR/SARP family transcriptional regulator n=1 Tax=Streptomyces sp. 1222.5 TaxID=1881026 RepID=UPI003EBB3BE6